MFMDDKCFACSDNGLSMHKLWHLISLIHAFHFVTCDIRYICGPNILSILWNDDQYDVIDFCIANEWMKM